MKELKEDLRYQCSEQRQSESNFWMYKTKSDYLLITTEK